MANVFSLLSFLLLIIIISLISSVSSSYNLINTVPTCFTNNICTEYGKPGTELSIHPNSEERTEFLFRNIARLFPTEYIESKYGKYLFGKEGTTTQLHPNCGSSVIYPFYYDSQLNELARFHAYDALQCDETIGHNTCSTKCYLFDNQCAFKARTDKFIINGIGSNTETNTNDDIIEDTWSGNIGYATDSHCLWIYDPSYIYQGIGIMPNTNLVNTVYAKLGNGPLPSYPIIHGGHFDERDRIHSDDYNEDGKYLVFMVEYFGDIIDHIAVNNMYLLYDGNIYNMNLIFGDKYSGFYALNFQIDNKDNCKPYAFFVVTEIFTIYRLPQDINYFYSTSMIGNDEIGICDINHFYNDAINLKWVANGSPNINNLNEIKGIDNTNCINCQEINGLQQQYNLWTMNIDLAADTTLTPTIFPSESPIKQEKEMLTTITTNKPIEDTEGDKELLCCHGARYRFKSICKHRIYDKCLLDARCFWDDNDCYDDDNIIQTTNDQSDSKSYSMKRMRNKFRKKRKKRKKRKSKWSWKWQTQSSDSSDTQSANNQNIKENENQSKTQSDSISSDSSS